MKHLFKKFLNYNTKLDYFENLIKKERSSVELLDYSFKEVPEEYSPYVFLKSQELGGNVTDKQQNHKVRPIVLSNNIHPYLLNHPPAHLSEGPSNQNIEKIFSRSFFSGYPLKQVNGGYIVELGGFFCFLPYSLGNNIKKGYHHQDIYTKGVQFFHLYKTTVTINRERNYLLNIIVSKRQSQSSLKKILKAFNRIITEKGHLYIKNKGQIKIRNKKIRIFIKFLKNKQQYFFKRFKEVTPRKEKAGKIL